MCNHYYDLDDYEFDQFNDIDEGEFFGDMEEESDDFELDGLDEEEFIDLELEMEALYETGVLRY
tara:strand:- start:1905 stop:2096 length:192 start_codon:yes stop_codon:yes gene_type:complete